MCRFGVIRVRRLKSARSRRHTSSPVMPLSPADALKRRLVEADLCSGAEALARYRQHGVPAAVAKAPGVDPDRVLRQLCEQVRPEDLSGGFAELWRSAATLWLNGVHATLEDALNACDPYVKSEASEALVFARKHGMGIAYQAPVAARRLLTLRESLENYSEAIEIAEQALEQAGMAVRGA